ncbi:unnamed protein product [Bordetella petrii]|uniref:Uncharacterized protein n=1 Tax=Bordetella petrii (strain ATCC BAA-461 / DSM 12804 / CCUG 43448 / CIP 107267 / Se-1111R) TaxID=340100 RepID=A9ISL8_BORPD|nr:unnamed protein product [Bordetella petrii]
MRYAGQRLPPVAGYCEPGVLLLLSGMLAGGGAGVVWVCDWSYVASPL